MFLTIFADKAKDQTAWGPESQTRSDKQPENTGTRPTKATKAEPHLYAKPEPADLNPDHGHSPKVHLYFAGPVLDADMQRAIGIPLAAVCERLHFEGLWHQTQTGQLAPRTVPALGGTVLYWRSPTCSSSSPLVDPFACDYVYAQLPHQLLAVDSLQLGLLAFPEKS